MTALGRTALGAACLALALTVASCGASPSPDAAADAGSATTAARAGVEREIPIDLSGVVLPDASQGGAPFPLRAADGKILLVYFGYTNCPDVCPTTLSEVKRIRRDLGEDAGRVEVAMVTVDPARDTAEVLTGYLGHFFDDAHALRTDDPAVLAAATAAVGGTVTTRPTTDAEHYTVDHVATLFAVDPSGVVVAEWPFGTPATSIEQELRNVLDEENR